MVRFTVMSEHGLNPPDRIPSACSAVPRADATNHRIGLPVAIDLVVCGVAFPALTLVARRLQADFHSTTMLVGLFGGCLCLIWGIMGRQGRECRLGAVVTLAITACAFAWQAAGSWQSTGIGESSGRMVAMLMAVLSVFSLGMISNLIQDGKRQEP